MQPRLDIFFNLFKACFDGVTFYPSGNPVVTQQIESFIRACSEHMVGDCLVLTLGARGFVLGDEQVPHKMRTSPGVGWMESLLSERFVHTLVFYKGLSIRDVEKLIGVLKGPPESFEGPNAASDKLQPHNIWRVQINTIPASKATSESPFTALSTDSTFSDLSFVHMPEPIAQQGLKPDSSVFETNLEEPAKPADVGSDFDPLFTPKLLIAAEEQATLNIAMNEALARHQLQRVAETLTMIRADLGAAEREDRELAYSSYQVVVACLIEHKESKSLLIVLKSMGNDLLACKDEDLFGIHMATLVQIIVYFRENNQLKGVAYGLNILANQSLRQEGAHFQMIDKALMRIMDLKLIEKMISDEDASLRPVRKALLHRHGLGVLKPLLSALFLSEDRHMRKRLLEVITNLGTLSYPYLMDELERAINERKPWYVKRNLLTLLSISPPPDLVNFLPSLYEEDRPKMRDLVVRCLYQIHTPAAFKMGRKLLRDATGARLMKALRYVEVNRHGAYAHEILNVFQRVEDAAIRKEAILILGKIDTEESITYLADILGKSAELGKVSVEYRAAAAKALGRSRRQKALDILIKYRRDFSKDVRDIVGKILAAEQD